MESQKVSEVLELPEEAKDQLPHIKELWAKYFMSFSHSSDQIYQELADFFSRYRRWLKPADLGATDRDFYVFRDSGD